MTRVELTRGADPVASDAVAYADREWLAGGAEPVVRLEVADAADAAADRAAGLVLLRLAVHAWEELAATSKGHVDVIGDGFVAGVLEALLDADGRRGVNGHPAAAVDTTGDPARIREALARLDDLGLLVLAGEAGGRPLELDMYPDIHVRGLRIVGVPLEPIASPEGLPAAALEFLEAAPPAAATPGRSTLPARWYRFDS